MALDSALLWRQVQILTRRYRDCFDIPQPIAKKPADRNENFSTVRHQASFPLCFAQRPENGDRLET
jgi:hypothetical protein